MTRDRDFGNLVFVKALGAGVLCLRMLPSNQTEVHDEMDKVLDRFSEQELAQAFVVVEKDRHRIRWIRTAQSE